MEKALQNNDSMSQNSEEYLLIDLDSSSIRERPRRVNVPAIPKLPLHQLFQPRMPIRSVVRSRSQRLMPYPDAQIVAQAKSIKYQSRFEGLARAVKSRPILQRISPDDWNASVNDEQVLEADQELKIKNIQCEGLKAHLMMEKAKWQTDKLLSERHHRRQQQEIDDLNRKIQMIQGKCFKEGNSTLMDDYLSNTQFLLSARSHRKLQRSQGKEDDRILVTERRNIQQIEQRMAKLKQIQAQQKRAAESLMRIMGQIKAAGSRQSSREKTPIRIDKAVNTQETKGLKSARASTSIYMLQEMNINESTEVSENIMALKEENCRLKGEFVSTSKIMAGMAEEFKQFRIRMETNMSTLEKSHKKLESQKSQLSTLLSLKEIEMENLKLTYNQLTKKLNQSSESDPASKQQIEVLQYQTFNLKAKIQQLTEANHTLEVKLEDQKANGQKKLSELYSVIGSLEMKLQQSIKQKQVIAEKLKSIEEITQNIETEPQLKKNKTRTSTEDGNLEEQTDYTPNQEYAKLRKKIRQQEDEIEEMSKTITQLEEDLMVKQKQLSVYRNKKQAKKVQEDLQHFRNLINELQNRLLAQQEGHINEMQISFSREQQCIDRLADKQIQMQRLQNQVRSLRKFQDDLQKNCQQMSSSVQNLKETNEKMYQQIRSLSAQKSQLQEKLQAKQKSASRSTAVKPSSNPLAIAEQENTIGQEGASCQEYLRLVNELKCLIKQQSRLCQQLLSSIEKKQTIQELNKVNDHLQAKLIQINFCPEFKGSLWESSENRECSGKLQPPAENYSEGQLNRSQASFIKEFLDKSDERNAFNDQIEKMVGILLGSSSELGVLIHKFLINLFHYPNHSYLFDQIQSFLCDVREYEQHIDTKFKNLERSIGEYLNQANAVLHIGEASEVDPSISFDSGVKSQDNWQRPIIPPFQGFQTEVRPNKQIKQAQEKMGAQRNSEAELQELEEQSQGFEVPELNNSEQFKKQNKKDQDDNKKQGSSKGSNAGRRFSSNR